jgi:hypothetical protein
MMEVKMLTERFIMVLNVFKGFSSPVYALKPSCSQCLIVLVGVSEIMSGVSDVLEKYGFLQVINKNSSSWSLNFRFGPEGPNLPQKGERGGDASRHCHLFCVDI